MAEAGCDWGFIKGGGDDQDCAGLCLVDSRGGRVYQKLNFQIHHWHHLTFCRRLVEANCRQKALLGLGQSLE